MLKFENGLKKIGIYLDDEKKKQIYYYFMLLKEYNEKVNLTALKNDDEIIDKHFFDSLLLFKVCDFSNKRAIDIGTGAGFPGMVLAIANPELNIVLVDSIGKKLDFLRQLRSDLKLKNAEIVKERAENLGEHFARESFDVGLCRAVGELRLILEYIIPFLKVNGVFLAQKVKFSKEVVAAENSLKTLNSYIKIAHYFNLPLANEERAILEIEKTEKTELKYPRRTGIPKKRPL